MYTLLLAALDCEVLAQTTFLLIHHRVNERLSTQLCQEKCTYSN